jgi:GxxExxY protein
LDGRGRIDVIPHHEEHEGHEESRQDVEFDDLSNKVIGCALEVHRHLGPGLLESAYAQCVAHELSIAGIPFELERPIPVNYKGKRLDCGFRADIMVDDSLIVELKSVQELLPIHEAQLLTYMKLAGVRIGLLMNFNVRVLKDGLKRMVL